MCECVCICVCTPFLSVWTGKTLGPHSPAWAKRAGPRGHRRALEKHTLHTHAHACTRLHKLVQSLWMVATHRDDNDLRP